MGHVLKMDKDRQRMRIILWEMERIRRMEQLENYGWLQEEEENQEEWGAEDSERSQGPPRSVVFRKFGNFKSMIDMLPML